MGSILSKLFGGGGGGNSQHRNNNSATEPILQQQQQQQQQSIFSTSSTTSSSPSTTPSQTTPIKFAPTPGYPSYPGGQLKPESPSIPVQVNLLEVEIDEEAFKEDAVPSVYTSTIEARIDRSPPHPLELAVAPIATLDADSLLEESTKDLNLNYDPNENEEDDLQHNRSSNDIEDAVIKIQAGFRGFLVRKQMATNGGKAGSGCCEEDKKIEETILPAPKYFDTSMAPSEGAGAPQTTIIKKRIETPRPGSPPYTAAQDDTNYSILDDIIIDNQSAQQLQHLQHLQQSQEIPLAEELDIFKKINEINQLLATRSEDDPQHQPLNFDEIEKQIVPPPPPQRPQMLEGYEGCDDNFIKQSKTSNITFSSTSISNALEALDSMIREHDQDRGSETDLISAASQPSILINDSSFAEPQISSSSKNNNNNKDDTIDQNQRNEESQKCEDDPPLEHDEPSATQVAAAIRIQAAFRGYEVRKSLSREVSPVPDNCADVVAQNSLPEPSGFDAINSAVESISESIQEQTISQSIPESAVQEPIQEQTILESIPQSIVQETIQGLIQEQSILESIGQEPAQEQTIPQSIRESSVLEPTQEPIQEQTISQSMPESIVLEPIQEQSDPSPISDIKPDIAAKHGLGTVSSIEKVEEIVEAPQTLTTTTETETITTAPPVDIEKSIQELEQSFDRDLLAEEDQLHHHQAKEIAKAEVEEKIENEEKIQIKIQFPDNETKEIENNENIAKQESKVPMQSSLIASKIPVSVERQKSILKEPSSPEPNNTSADDTKDADEDSADEISQTSQSPIPLRASSPSPFGKKRHRKHNRNHKKK